MARIFNVVIRKGKDQIIVESPGREPSYYFPESETKFFNDLEESIYIEFTKNKKNEISGFIFGFGDKSMKGKKI